LPPEQSNKIFITAIPSVNSQNVMKDAVLKILIMCKYMYSINELPYAFSNNQIH